MKKTLFALILGFFLLHESPVRAGGNYLPCSLCQRDCRSDAGENWQQCYQEKCKDACPFLPAKSFTSEPRISPKSIEAVRLGETTATGIPIESTWKAHIYRFARENSIHPSWGIAHSERNYQTTQKIAQEEGILVDSDVLFAAAFLHDVGGLAAFAKKGVDHAVRSVEVIEPLLMSWGFPMQKWPEVKEMILGHSYYGRKPHSRAALAFRDADILDFLGNIGVARILALTGEPSFFDGTLQPTVKTLNSFAQTMASECSLKACEKLAGPRQKEVREFLDKLSAYTFSDKAL